MGSLTQTTGKFSLPSSKLKWTPLIQITILNITNKNQQKIGGHHWKMMISHCTIRIIMEWSMKLGNDRGKRSRAVRPWTRSGVGIDGQICAGSGCVSGQIWLAKSGQERTRRNSASRDGSNGELEVRRRLLIFISLWFWYYLISIPINMFLPFRMRRSVPPFPFYT